MVRLKDIAERAGVSVMTVSKVLRDAPDISPATKARIRLLAEQMGYVPDSLAQGLRTRTSKLLGLIISSLTNPVYAQVANAIEEKSFELGYELLLAQSLNLPEKEEVAVRRFLSRRVDGLFIAPVYRLAPIAPVYQELQRSGVPTVLLGPCAPFCNAFPCVECEDATGSYAATQHLLQLGHRKIAFLAGPTAAPWAQERLHGYKQALREHQLDPDDRYVIVAGATVEEGFTAARDLLDECPEITAIQTAHDLAAIGAGEHILSRGWKIPETISLIGFGNSMISQHFRIPLTTVRQPKYRLGHAAVESMQRLLRGESIESTRLGVDLIIRQSCGSPR